MNEEVNINFYNVFVEFYKFYITEIRRISMGFVFQSIALISIMTAFENVDLGLRIAEYDVSGRRDRAKECLAFVGLGIMIVELENKKIVLLPPQ